MIAPRRELAHWRFRPPVWAVLTVIPACAFLLSLGWWQLQRGEAKAALQSRYAEAAGVTPVVLSGGSAAVSGTVQQAQARGHYLAGRQLLLDNQSYRRQPGYQVWTPLRLTDGALIVVNRGWIAGGGDRAAAPYLGAPPGEIEVRGLWRALPEPGLRLVAGACRKAETFPLIVNYPQAAELSCLLDEPVVAGELLLDPQAPGGYVRDWGASKDFPPERHYAYAAQWFTFALTLFVIFIKLNLKRIHD